MKLSQLSSSTSTEKSPILSAAVVVLLLATGGVLYWAAGFLYPEGIRFGSPMKQEFVAEEQATADEYVQADGDERTGLGEQAVVEAPVSIIETDTVFEAGFADTGLTWQPTEENWSKELKQNPLCSLRASYCARVGQDYADFGCDCFTRNSEIYGRYTDTEDPFTIYYDKFWRVASSSSSDIIADQKVSIQREGAVCVMSYGRVREQSLLELPDAYGDTVTVDGTELRRITVPYARAVSDEERAAGYTDTRTIALPHFPYQNSEFGLMLTSFERQPLLEICAREFDEIYSGVTIYYPQTSLNAESVGELHIPLYTRWYISESGENHKVNLLFHNDRIERKEELGSGIFGESADITDPMVIGNTLYYIDDQNQDRDTIKAFDLFGSRGRTIDLPYDDNNPVHSFFVEGDWIYYLSGTFCNEYMYKCSLNLDRYTMTNGVLEHLASGLSSRDIDGFDAEKNILYMNYIEGDAGCAWSSYEAYSMKTKSVEKMGEHSYCEGDVRDPREAFANLVSNLVTVDHLVVRDGTISAPEQKMIWDGSLPRGRFIRVNVSRTAEL